MIDIEFANQSAGGKRVLAAIEAGDAVHTSTGLLAIMDAANGDVPYKFTARDIEFGRLRAAAPAPAKGSFSR